MSSSLSRLLIIMSLAAAGVHALAGCGPSGTQIKTARAARYQADQSAVLRHVVEAVQRDYRLQLVDTEAGVVETVERWYEEDGTFAQLRALPNGRGVNDRSIKLNYRIALVHEAGTIAVEITPIAGQKRSGYSALFPLHPGEPDMPGWIAGKTDLLQVAIHEQLRAYVEHTPVAHAR